MEVGSVVRVLEPFDRAFPEQYTVVTVTVAGCGAPIIYLQDIESAFDPRYLEVVT